MKEVRRAAKDTLFFQAEVARLEKLLLEAGVESSKRSTIMSLRMEVFQLREALQVVAGRERCGRRCVWTVQIKLPKAVSAPKSGKDTACGAARGQSLP